MRGLEETLCGKTQSQIWEIPILTEWAGERSQSEAERGRAETGSGNHRPAPGTLRERYLQGGGGTAMRRLKIKPKMSKEFGSKEVSADPESEVLKVQ